MYYHFDYHGPISYEWINSSYLPKIWEQMSMAYDFGVRDLWIVNVGDISTQEYPCHFSWIWLTILINGERRQLIPQIYTRKWIQKQFEGVLDDGQATKRSMNC